MLACHGGGEDGGGGSEGTQVGTTEVVVTAGVVGGDTGDSSGDGSSSEGGGPPVECGPLTACGVQCTDVMTDPGNCGQCGVSCVIPGSAPACVAGSCAIGTCQVGYADCDQNIDNGCELPLAQGQPCPFVCTMGAAEQCNLQDDNCDAQCDEGAVVGCRQPVHRASSPTIGHFYTLDANEAMSGDITPESLNYFYTYAVAVPGLVPLYRCLKGNGKRLYTTSDACEGAGTLEGSLGYVAGDGACGATPLYRLYNSTTQEHFYTVSAGERDNAVQMYGFVFESVAGNVWSGP